HHPVLQRRRNHRLLARFRGGRSRLLRPRRRLPRRRRSRQPHGPAPALLAPPGSLLVGMKPLVTLYTRAGCCLCDDAKRVIDAARAGAVFDYEEIDIDTDPGLLRLYNDEVPVITINRVKAFKYRVNVNDLLKKLRAR